MFIKQSSKLSVIVKNKKTDSKYIESNSVESLVLFAILEKLEEIRTNTIDLETGIENIESAIDDMT